MPVVGEREGREKEEGRRGCVCVLCVRARVDGGKRKGKIERPQSSRQNSGRRKREREENWKRSPTKDPLGRAPAGLGYRRAGTGLSCSRRGQPVSEGLPCARLPSLAMLLLAAAPCLRCPAPRPVLTAQSIRGLITRNHFFTKDRHSSNAVLSRLGSQLSPCLRSLVSIRVAQHTAQQRARKSAEALQVPPPLDLSTSATSWGQAFLFSRVRFCSVAQPAKPRFFCSSASAAVDGQSHLLLACHFPACIRILPFFSRVRAFVLDASLRVMDGDPVDDRKTALTATCTKNYGALRQDHIELYPTLPSCHFPFRRRLPDPHTHTLLHSSQLPSKLRPTQPLTPMVC